MARATRQATAPRAGQVVLLLDAVGVPREHVGRTGVIADVRPSASVVVVVDGDSGARESVDVPAGAFLTAETLLYNDKDCLSPMRPPPGLLHKQDDRNNGRVDEEVDEALSCWVEYAVAFIDPETCIDLCVMCLGGGSPADFLICIDCGECCHTYCIGDATTTITLARRERWRCPNCMICIECGSADCAEQLLQCDICDSGTHLACTRPRLYRIPETAFLCGLCAPCIGCGQHLANQDTRICSSCASARRQCMLCPICRQSWRTNDSEPMVQCDQCDLWVHCNCDGIDGDQYDALTNDFNATYFCPFCRCDRPWSPGHLSPVDSEQSSLPDLFGSIREMVAQTQEKRRRSRRRLLLNTARHLSKGNAHVKVLSRKRHFRLIRLLPAESAKPPTAPVVDKNGAVPAACTSFASVLSSFVDKRQCCFCGAVGDLSDADRSRLLPCRRGLWAHANCIIYSSATIDSETGTITGIEAAIERSRQLQCEQCGGSGAGLSCRASSCRRSYHLHCARTSGCLPAGPEGISQFTCLDHMPRGAASKRVLGDMESTISRVRSCLTVPRNVLEQPWAFPSPTPSIRIGALTVDRLPQRGLVGFCSRRIFWSTLAPASRTVYTCMVSEGVQFTISEGDRPGFVIRTSSASSAFQALIEAIPAFIDRNAKRTPAPGGGYLAFGLTGDVFFGFGHPGIQRLTSLGQRRPSHRRLGA
ncbi:PHD-type domain-containing protein [Plasmodiophora brassicae]